MKIFLLFALVLVSVSSFSQEKEFILSGRILAYDSSFVSNAYIINFRTMAAYSSKSNGQFNIRVEHGDSMMVNHISFIRKKIYADSVLLNPEIYLEYDTIMLKQIDYGADEKLKKNLDENMGQIKNAEIIQYKRMDPEMDLINKTMVENNSVLRSEASSLHIASFSPSEVASKIFKGKRKIDKQRGYNFYRNEAQKARKERRKQKAE
jgi:hypothetical protein